MRKEKSLLDRYVSRARDFSGNAFTRQSLTERCESNIRLFGPEARTSVQLKGERGRGLKKHRRLTPSGPLGEVTAAGRGLITIEFPSVGLMASLENEISVFSALARFYMDYAEPPYPKQMTLELAVKFAHEHLRVEIEQEVLEKLLSNYESMPRILGNGHALIVDILKVEAEAMMRRWKRVELAKWLAAGLSWPVQSPVVKKPRPLPAKPQSVVYRVSERHAKLLRLFDQAGEEGKRHIEETASFAAASRPSATSNKPVH